MISSSETSKWDRRYINLAREASVWSKDPSSKIGAVAISRKGQVLSTGYNGFPRGINDSLTRYQNRELKYKMVVHAEMNAIFNATYNGVSLDGATMYVYGLPVCSECAKGLIQVGIKRVVIEGEIQDRWKESWKLTEQLFKEANVEWEFIK
jgi:dCMP deaminase